MKITIQPLLQVWSNLLYIQSFQSQQTMLAGCVIGVDTFMAGTFNFVPEHSFKILDFCRGKGDFKTAQESQNFLGALERSIVAHG